MARGTQITELGRGLGEYTDHREVCGAHQPCRGHLDYSAVEHSAVRGCGREKHTVCPGKWARADISCLQGGRT